MMSVADILQQLPQIEKLCESLYLTQVVQLSFPGFPRYKYIQCGLGVFQS